MGSGSFSIFWYVVTWSHSASGDSEASRPSFSGLSSLPLTIWALHVLASILYSVAVALASCALGVWTYGGSLGSGEGAAWEVLCLWDSRLDTHTGKSLFVGHVPSGPWLLRELQHWGHLGGYFVYVLAAWNPGPMSFCLLQTNEKDVSKEGANNWYLVGFCNWALSPWVHYLHHYWNQAELLAQTASVWEQAFPNQGLFEKPGEMWLATGCVAYSDLLRCPSSLAGHQV